MLVLNIDHTIDTEYIDYHIKWITKFESLLFLVMKGVKL